MKRRHTRAVSVAFCQTLRDLRPDIVFGADIIAGFPTETDEMFHQSISLIEECGLTWLHVFPFSPRPGTPAARRPQVAGKAVRDRAARIRAAGGERVAAHFTAMRGREVHLLMEQPDLGRTEGFAQTRLPGDYTPGEIVKARVLGRTEGILLAEAA